MGSKSCDRLLPMPHSDPNDPRRAAASRRHYQANKAAYIERAKSQKEKTRDYVRSIKESKPCKDCGKSYPYYVMQFDHVGGDKVGDIGKMQASGPLRAIKVEIEKCELVCANCHATKTWIRLVNHEAR